MANVVRRENFQVILSVDVVENPELYPSEEWLINPLNLFALIGNGSPDNPQVPKIYWIVDPPESTNLREMTQAEKNFVNPAAILNAARAEQRLVLITQATVFVNDCYTESEQNRFLQLAACAEGSQLDAIAPYFIWYRSVMEALRARLQQTNIQQTVESIQAVNFDPLPFIQSDPRLTLENAIG